MSTKKITSDANFLQRLEEVREASHLNKSNFAKKSGISPSFYTDILKGRSEPAERTVRQICREFTVSEEWLLYGEGSFEVKKVHRALTDDQEKLLELLEGVPLDPDVIAELGRNADAREMMENYIRLPKSRQKRRLGDVIADREELEKDKD